MIVYLVVKLPSALAAYKKSHRFSLCNVLGSLSDDFSFFSAVDCLRSRHEGTLPLEEVAEFSYM